MLVCIFAAAFHVAAGARKDPDVQKLVQVRNPHTLPCDDETMPYRDQLVQCCTNQFGTVKRKRSAKRHQLTLTWFDSENTNASDEINELNNSYEIFDVGNNCINFINTCSCACETKRFQQTLNRNQRWRRNLREQIQHP